MKTREQYEKWLNKNIEGWKNSTDNNSIDIIFKSGKSETVELFYFSEPSNSKFSREELAIALLKKKY